MVYVFWVGTDIQTRNAVYFMTPAADCPAIDAYREALANGGTAVRPAPNVESAPNFGNSDIFGGTFDAP